MNKQHSSLHNLELLWLSVITLYLEMLLIRWIGVEVRIFAYLSNFILIACFLGFGIGCFQSKSAFRPLQSLILIFSIIFLVSEPFGITIIPFRYITQMLGGTLQDLPIWAARPYHNVLPHSMQLLTGISLTIILFVMVVFALVPFGRRVGYIFDHHPNTIAAYSLNVAGSLLGTWLFAFLSYLQTAPWLWFLLLLIPMFMYIPMNKKQIILWGLVGSGIIFAILPWRDNAVKTYWSPYQKLVLTAITTADEKLQRGYRIDVNNTGYQVILNLSREFLASHPEYFNVQDATRGHYNIPYHFVKDVGSVLVVGAGAGNDCAAALRNGAEQVDCVEIDPVIARLGQEFHPEKPYQNEKVNLIIDDARPFFGKTSQKYDVIWFGLLDSHTLGSAYNNVRLDHYVYTVESFRAAGKLLKENGLIFVYFQAETDWIAKRLYGVLEKAFGHAPEFYRIKTQDHYYGWGGNLYVIGQDKKSHMLNSIPPNISEFLESSRIELTSDTQITTDDWPFLYLQNRRIPSIYILVSTCLFLIFMGFRRQIFKSTVRFDWRFFFLGGGFLLVEVQSVTKAGLLFGSTWIANCLIISQVLIWILLSNLTYAKFKIDKLNIVFFLLFADLMMIYFIPLNLFTAMPHFLMITLGSLHLTMPVFFAGMIFIHLFNNCQRKDNALGANIIGALAGGLLESGAFVFGQKSLLLLAAAFYVCVIIVHSKKIRPA